MEEFTLEMEALEGDSSNIEAAEETLRAWSYHEDPDKVKECLEYLRAARGDLVSTISLQELEDIKDEIESYANAGMLGTYAPDLLDRLDVLGKEC